MPPRPIVPFIRGRVPLWWFDALSYALQFGNTATPGSPGFGYDLGGSWHLVCDTGEEANHWSWVNLGHTQLCGLGGQAMPQPIDVAPPSSTVQGYIEITDEGQAPDRYRIVRQYHRDDPNDGVPIVERYNNPVYSVSPLPHWPVDLPLPSPFWVPGAQPAPTPLPTPYPRIPHRPVIALPTPGVHVSERGNGDTSTGSWEEGKTDDRPDPYGPPTPARPPGPRERERKQAYTRATAAITALVSQITEGMDTVKAFYYALPDRIRRAEWRARGGFVSPQAKAEILWRNWREVDVEQALRNYFRQQFTDWFWAQTGRADRGFGQGFNGHGIEGPGFTSASGNTRRAEEIEAWYLDQTGVPLKRLDPAGEAFDWLYFAIFGDQ